ncbi:hypothetical protein BEH94_10065 [Candidatus Altiarchaeales archaeon WOR_SM1_SCG]|nr:hypothetical protein BEH94_10065 [Candidatus Altiarchaeales archaeon WOR_SM1_SCG]
MNLVMLKLWWASGKIIIRTMKSETGSKTEKSDHLRDGEKSRIVIDEINKFNHLVKGHLKLLSAIGKL